MPSLDSFAGFLCLDSHEHDVAVRAFTAIGHYGKSHICGIELRYAAHDGVPAANIAITQWQQGQVPTLNQAAEAAEWSGTAVEADWPDAGAFAFEVAGQSLRVSAQLAPYDARARISFDRNNIAVSIDLAQRREIQTVLTHLREDPERIRSLLQQALVVQR